MWTKKEIILQTTTFHACSSMKIVIFWSQYHNNLSSRLKIDKKQILGQVMAWHQKGNKLLPEQWWFNSLTCIYTYICMHRWALMCQLKTYGDLYQEIQFWHVFEQLKTTFFLFNLLLSIIRLLTVYKQRNNIRPSWSSWNMWSAG